LKPVSAPIESDGVGIVFDGVAKRYGARIALQDISLEIAAGEFIALLGPNGAGKTTLLRLAAGLTRPTAGRVRITSGNGANTQNPKRKIGIVAHETFLYDELTAEENLQFFAKLYGVPDSLARTTELLQEAGLASAPRVWCVHSRAVCASA